jgi:hypothetical protein
MTCFSTSLYQKILDFEKINNSYKKLSIIYDSWFKHEGQEILRGEDDC